MSAPSESAASPAPCACTNISLMQLFHELKQKFPGVPDHVVSNTIELYCHDKQACEKQLHSEVKASLTHAYHASSSAAARQQTSQLRLIPPPKCRNQPIIKQEVSKPSSVQSVACPGPQKGILSAAIDKIANTDDNQNIVEVKNEDIIQTNNVTSPTTVINIDNCHIKYSADSPSDLELTNENTRELKPKTETSQEKVSEQPESTNYRILKSNKIRSNLNERLEKGKEKKTIKKEEIKKEEIKQEVPVTSVTQEKRKRPNTLDFIKPNPDIAFKQTLREPEPDPCRTVSPAQSRNDTHSNPNLKYRPERGYPLNLSVNVNCHMDLGRSYDPWEDFDSPRAITSVNLTVCTPTSSMASPVRDSQDDGFEGHVTVTVSPSTARPQRPMRRAPSPPQPSRIDSPMPSRPAPEPPGSTHGKIL